MQSSGAVEVATGAQEDKGTVKPTAERQIVMYIIAISLLLTILPYLLGYAISQPGYRFVGQSYNIDDFCVYLSWTRQAADGHFWARDLFTTDPQKNIEFNVLFLLLGQIARLTHCPIPILFQLVRVLAGGAALFLIYRLYRLCAPHSPATRITALGMAALGAGFGWLFWPDWAVSNAGNYPIDVWQAEAFTFLSIYFSVHFAVATLLIAATLYCVVLGEQTGRTRFAAYAGLCVLLIGNIHSYDVIHVAAAWGLYLIVKAAILRRIDYASWGRALLAALIGLPSVAYQYWVFKTDPAFHARANVPTLSPPLILDIMGYGLIFVLAALGLFLFLGRRTRFLAQFANWQAAGFVACWAVAGFAISYAPHVSFQRKMIMGEEIPLSLLAGAAAAYFVRNLTKRTRVVILTLLVLATVPTNALSMYRQGLQILADRSDTNVRPFLSANDLDTLNWIRDNTRPEDGVIGFPVLMIFVPGYCDRAVYMAHWGETPQFGNKLVLFNRFAQADTPAAARIAFLRQTHTQYLVYPTHAAAINDTSRQPLNYADFAGAPPTYLLPVHRNDLYTIFAIRLP